MRFINIQLFHACIRCVPEVLLQQSLFKTHHKTTCQWTGRSMYGNTSNSLSRWIRVFPHFPLLLLASSSHTSIPELHLPSPCSPSSAASLSPHQCLPSSPRTSHLVQLCLPQPFSPSFLLPPCAHPLSSAFTYYRPFPHSIFLSSSAGAQGW